MVESFRARSGSASGDYRRRARSDATSLAGLGRGVPDADGTGARPGDVAVVGAVGDGDDHLRVPRLEAQQQLARLGVPHLHVLVDAAADDAFAVVAVRDGQDRLAVAPQRRAHLLALLDVPDAQRVVVAAGDEA